MAATCCSFTQSSSGFRKLHENIQLQSYFTRYQQRSTCSVENIFHRDYGGRFLQVEGWHQHQYLLCARGVELSPSANEEVGEETEEDISKETLIWRAIKLPIYSVAFVPLTVGSAAVYFQTGIFSARCYFVLLASSVLAITWLNLSNDVYDFDTGVDKNKKESVVNLAGTFIAAYLCLAIGFLGLTWTAVVERNIRSILFLVCAIICGYIYQCPPFRLSYQGLGEPLCFAAFGPFATCAFYLLHGSSSVMNHFPLSGTVLSASILVGFTTSLILFCSHFHQVEGDKEVGKMSPLVRLGTKKGAEVVKGAVFMLYALLVAFGLIKALPLTCIFLCALTLPMGNLVVRFVEDNYKNKNKIFMAKYFCVRLHALFGVALALGLVLARNTKFTSWPILS
ncbi:2-carboxy-1,4-naphthoquinone phytyltransferase, chloroplastic-like isoform X2 [Glycine soja]|uniref:2-carboxy-1,4-naphthoquinone phytyltransferase, chloroplastic-like isoform X2 n=1 Tax=Glycine soja TaxID=3848 RepID=UPI0003DE83F6|nr:2-carboxy-1,4-naphthoquinone phytyltransferase, chloroplastic-like isoform X2 [Glycine soja]|eukprot:XP_006584972.1 2-carboxy-1,4-naphthoquinone phytyltransferase, chloroplastic isoform X2 [Glycine max]